MCELRPQIEVQPLSLSICRHPAPLDHEKHSKHPQAPSTLSMSFAARCSLQK